MVALALAFLGASAAADDDEGGEVAPAAVMRLRLEWGSGESRRWQGAIAVSEGTLARPVPLGIGADEPGSMWIEETRLLVHQLSPRPYDGVDFDASAPLDASLIVALSPADAPTSGPRIEIPLTQLLTRPYSSRLDDRKNVVQIQRAPGDKLRVDIDRPALIFQPGETLEMTVTPNQLLDAANTRVRLQARLLGVADKSETSPQEQQMQLDDTGSADGTTFSFVLPQNEGVYDVDLQVSRHRLGLWQPLHGGRRVQIMVLSRDPRMPDSTTELPFETLVDIDPAKPSWWQRLPNIPMLPSLRKPLGSGHATARPYPQGNLVKIDAADAEIGWEAYPLPIRKPGEPHIVEVQYPADVPQVLGISVVEPNQAGVLSPIGVDSGVYVPDDGEKAEAKMAVHRLVFWPRTETPLLRIDGSKAVYGRIRLLGPKQAGVTTMLQRDDWQTHSMLPRRFPAGGERGGRLLAGYYDRPLFAENFSAGQTLDTVRKFSLHDWRTFYQGGTRLVEYLHYMGYNGLMVAVAAEGSALYPSELLQATPRYDTGAYFTTAQDAQRKDVVELLFRLFDREGLTLIPAIDFSTPLPALEALRRDDENAGLELIDRHGDAWLKRHPPRQELAPYYNPLDERVQDAMIDVVREFVLRYQRHPSFGGVALQLTANGFAQLPGADCGFDEATLEKFQTASKVRLPVGDGSFASRIAPLLENERPKWLAWRADKMARFYRRVQEEMSAERPGLKLYLAGSALFDRPELARELRPVLARASSKNEETLAGVGIAPELFADDGNIVLLRPNRIAPLRSLPAQAINLEVNLDPQLDRRFAELPNTAALFYHEPQEGRLDSFDAQNPFKGPPARRMAQLAPSGAHNRRRFVHAMATLDARAMFDGGRLLSLGQEHEMGPLVAAFCGLPDVPFETVEGDSQPVTVRSLSHAGRTYVYFANDSPWKAKVQVTVEKPAECTVLSLYRGNPVQAPTGEGLKQKWTVALEGYELMAAHFSTEGVKLSSPQAELDAAVATRLEAYIQDLTERARVLKEPAPLNVPANRDFEQQARSGLPGWDITPAPLALHGPLAQPGDVTLDVQQPHGGEHSVRLSARENKVAITSSPFAPPATGWLVVSVWLRTVDANPPPRLTISLEGKLAATTYRRHTELPGTAKGPKLTEDWKEFRFEFKNIPTEGLSPLRLRFLCEGRGDIWIDDVRLFDLDKWEGNELVTLVWLAIGRVGVKLEKHQYADCWQLLEGYWPRYLRTFVPLSEEPIANHPRPRRTTSSAPPAKTGFYDRLRSWWR
ncbi:MAG TPA: family 10 glycosylhydrolase [Pirellulales bacterium]|nr:family 10 glycosylhydrolase [Pirellulales bacterium]